MTIIQIGLSELEKFKVDINLPDSTTRLDLNFSSYEELLTYLNKLIKYNENNKELAKILINMKNDLERSYASEPDKSPQISDADNPEVTKFKKEREQKRLQTMEEIKKLFIESGMHEDEIKDAIHDLYEDVTSGIVKRTYKPDTYTSVTLSEQRKSLEEELSKNGKLWKKAKRIAKECKQQGEVKDMERAVKEDTSPKMSDENNPEVKEFKKERTKKRLENMNEIKKLFTTNGMTDSQITANLNKLYQDIDSGIVKDKYKSAMAVSPTLNGQKQSLDEELAKDGKLWKKASRLANNKKIISDLKQLL